MFFLLKKYMREFVIIMTNLECPAPRRGHLGSTTSSQSAVTRFNVPHHFGECARGDEGGPESGAPRADRCVEAWS